MTQHPLEPLTADEFRQTASILRREGRVSDSFRFASIELKEPPKSEVRAWRQGDAVQRTSFAVVFNRADNQTYEATVDLTGDSVVSFEHIPDVTPNFTLDEFHDVDVALHQHPDVIAKLAARGFTDMSLVLIDVWTYGKALMPEQHRHRRLGWCDLWARETSGGNQFAHPISGLKLLVDMNTLELLEIEDHHDYGRPAVDAEYIPSVRGTQVRTDLKPLHITQPEGTSFTFEGTELKWQNWTMRLGFNYREGPVIYQVTFDDHGTTRDVAYRMSFAEMIVPYRDPTFDHYRRTAYDIGEWGLGVMTRSLELGCDCLGEIVYVDATLHDSKGDPYDIPNAICLHEEDNAVLWKHVDLLTGAEEAEAGRDYDWSTQRSWKVVNPNKVNKHGTNVSYKLVPGACFPAMMDPSTPQFLRAPVIGHNLWVTKNSADERWPAGDYPTQSTVDTGVSEWVKDDASLENTDVVLWYVFGIHHITRMEEWPIMAVDTVSFWLKPSGFFNQNPALDVAPNPES